MQNIDVQALGITEDVKMTRIFLVAQVNFFDTMSELEVTTEDTSLEELES